MLRCHGDQTSPLEARQIPWRQHGAPESGVADSWETADVGVGNFNPGLQALGLPSKLS